MIAEVCERDRTVRGPGEATSGGARNPLRRRFASAGHHDRKSDRAHDRAGRTVAEGRAGTEPIPELAAEATRHERAESDGGSVKTDARRAEDHEGSAHIADREGADRDQVAPIARGNLPDGEASA